MCWLGITFTLSHDCTLKVHQISAKCWSSALSHAQACIDSNAKHPECDHDYTKGREVNISPFVRPCEFQRTLLCSLMFVGMRPTLTSSFLPSSPSIDRSARLADSILFPLCIVEDSERLLSHHQTGITDSSSCAEAIKLLHQLSPALTPDSVGHALPCSTGPLRHRQSDLQGNIPILHPCDT